MKTIFRTITETAIVGYSAALVLEWMQPGFVTFFWNPQWLLVLALLGLVGVGFSAPAPSRLPGTIVFSFLFVIVAIGILLQIFPTSLSRYFALAAVLCIGIAYALLPRNFLYPTP
ncbi:MAG: hypothetical protein Q8P82_02730 [bacterium]|nr:hypothetical protein [bacterium]